MRQTKREEVWALVASVGLLGFAAMACNKKEESVVTTGASASAAPSTIAAVPAVTEVSRYPDEKPPSGAAETTVVKADVVARVTASVSGKSVGSSPTNGQKVTRVAEREGFVLIALDPSDVAKGQLGWVPADALAGGVAAAPTGAAQAKGPCKGNEVLVGKNCLIICQGDMECEGLVGINGGCQKVPGKSVNACFKAVGDAAEAEADLIGEMAPTSGEKCRPGWVFAESACHKPCTADGQCHPTTSYCKKWEGQRLCARTGSLVVPND